MLRLGFLILFGTLFCITECVHYNKSSFNREPRIKYLYYNTVIKSRYAVTSVWSSIANPDSKSHEVKFTLVLPENGFISDFVLSIRNKSYQASVGQKDNANYDYQSAVAKGNSAAHILQNVRDANQFDLLVNVEAGRKVMFNLTYEELLTRKNSFYRHTLHVTPGQIVKTLKVRVKIEETLPIVYLRVPEFKVKREAKIETRIDDKLVKLLHNQQRPNEATILWVPNPQEQYDIAHDGLKGELIIDYDVDRSKASEILSKDGFFVHFFAPNPLASVLPKHLVFILDVSGSMNGRKLEQMIEAMLKILDDLYDQDYYSIIVFSSEVTVWAPYKTEEMFKYFSDQDIIKRRNDKEILAATKENIEEGKTFVRILSADGSTNIIGALREGLKVTDEGQDKFLKEIKSSGLPHPIIVFLTDGEPNVEESDTNKIVEKITALNTKKVPIYSLAFGDGADINFLKALSTRNLGTAKQIYEAKDAALQLSDFYKGISAPVLSKINFKYRPGQIQTGSLTKHTFPLVFNGSEVVIAGKLNDNITCDQILFSIDSSSTNSLIDYTNPQNVVYHALSNTCNKPLPSSKNYSLVVTAPSSNNGQGKKINHRSKRKIDGLSLFRLKRDISNENHHVPDNFEKLWANIKIKQLIEEDAARTYKNIKDSPEREEAKQLSLKYGFLTPLTSMDVVTPDKSYGIELIKASSGSEVEDSDEANTTQAPPFNDFDPVSIPMRDYYNFIKEMVSFNRIRWLKEIREQAPNPYSFLIEIPLYGNYIIQFEEPDISYGNCSVHGQYKHGFCRHFQHCPLSTFMEDIEEYLPYFCEIDTSDFSFAGVCCPYPP